MPNRDIRSNVSPAQSLVPAVRVASANGTGVDLKGYDSVVGLVDVGLLTEGAFTFEMQESDDDSSYTAVADADLIGSEPVVDDGADDNQIYRVGYIGSKRYVRWAVTLAAQSPTVLTGLPSCASFVRGHPSLLPVA